MPDLSASTNLMSSPSMELLLYFCLFGFFGAIVATSLYLKWCSQSGFESTRSSHSSSQCTHLNGHPNGGHLKSHNNETSSPRTTTAPPPPMPYHPQQQHYQPPPQAAHGHVHAQPQPQPPMPLLGRHTQVILDWDDTLFPTAFTQYQLQRGIKSSRAMASCEVRQLRQLNSSVLRLLYGFIQLFGAANVCIVSNAREQWLRESCLLYQRLYGEVLDVLVRLYRIEVISAHDRYGCKKAMAFMDVLRQKRAIDQVICIGDSREEYEAIHSVCSVFRSASAGSPRKRNIHYYRLKLLESPSLEAMIGQLDAIQKLDFHAVTNQHYDRSFEFARQRQPLLQSVH